MKKLIVLVILILGVVGMIQWVGAWMRQHEFEEKLHDVALQVEDKNQDEIKRLVVAEGARLHLQVAPSDVNVRYSPTSDLGFAQRMVGKVGTFHNHRAIVTVDYTQPVLFVGHKRHVEARALIESAATANTPQDIPDR